MKVILIRYLHNTRSHLFLLIHLVKEETIINIYWNAEKSCRIYTKILGCYVTANQAMFIVAFVSSLYNTSVGNLDTSTWVFPFMFVVSFNTERGLGRYILCAIQFFMALSYSACTSKSTAYFVSTCVYINVICYHVNSLIELLKDDIHPNNETSEPKQIEFTMKMHGKLRNVVEVHVKLHE